MQNFREKYAYKISLYLLILAGFVIFFNNVPSSNFVILLWTGALIFRFISIDSIKHWKDINIFFIVILASLSYSVFSPMYVVRWAGMPQPCIAGIPCDPYPKNYSQDLSYLFSTPSNYLGIEFSFCIVVLIIISIIFSIKYLLELRKRDYRE
jgi:hypothetical protein